MKVISRNDTNRGEAIVGGRGSSLEECVRWRERTITPEQKDRIESARKNEQRLISEICRVVGACVRAARMKYSEKRATLVSAIVCKLIAQTCVTYV